MADLVAGIYRRASVINFPVCSAIHGATTPPLIEETIDEVFRRTAAAYPDREALIARHQEARLTFADLEAAVERTTRGLAGRGLQPGDRVGVWSTNCVEWVLELGSDSDSCFG